jgi:hypothetical protein
MTILSLPAALRAGAEGLYALEAATGLIIAHGTCSNVTISPASSTTALARRRSTGKLPSPPWTPAAFLARPTRSGCYD